VCPELVRKTDYDGRTAIFKAIESQNARLVEKLIASWPYIVYQPDKRGTTPVSFEVSFPGNADILRILWKNVTYGVNQIHKIFFDAFQSPTKAIFILDEEPELYYSAPPNSDNILHTTMKSAYRDTARIVVRHIHEHRPVLFTIANGYGDVAAHTTWDLDMLKMMFDLCPECVFVQNKKGRTPLHFESTPIFTKSFDSLIDILSHRPDTLSVQTRNGSTIAMKLFKHELNHHGKKVAAQLFELCPESFLLKTKQSRNFLHVMTMNKHAELSSICEPIVRAYPHLLFEPDSTGKSPIEYAISDLGGYGSFQFAREMFVAMCLKYTSLPEKYWIFVGISPSITESFGGILLRSEKDARAASEFLDPTHKAMVATLMLYIDLNMDLKRKIIAKLL
jgi:ankyrin repeat protein